MSLSLARKAAICFCWGLFLAAPAVVLGQTNYYTTNGTEYAIVGPLPGDQVWPDVALTTNGGFVVWQDNATDGSGWGLSAQRLDGTLSGTLSAFRVNATGTNDQENARVAMLKNGGAVFVWEGGVGGFQHIYARFLTSSNTWLTTTDVVVSVPTNSFQVNPAVAVLNNGNVVVVWSSFDEAGSDSMRDVYGRVFSETGQAIGGEFLVNQFTSYNQRSPAIAALVNGGFVIAWVSEQQRVVASTVDSSLYAAGGGAYVSTNENTIGTNQNTAASVPSVDIYGRIYNGNGVAQAGEFLVDTNGFNPCANPGVAAASDGSFMVAWGGRDMVNPTNGWDIYARTFSSAGAGGATALVNTHLPGSQYAPHISAIGADYLVMWTSLGQDGSREGVYGRFVHHDGTPVGGEFRVNTTTAGQQMHPVVASDGVSQFLAVWTSYTGSPYSFDLFAQRYVNVAAILLPMNAPIVIAPFSFSNNVYQPQLIVSWPALPGISVSNFEVYVDGAGTPAGVVTSNSWTMTAANGLAKNSTHSFVVDYVTTDARRSPPSPPASGSTWSGLNWGGIPYEWMESYFGEDIGQWPPANSPVASGGPTLLKIFLTGGIPSDPGTWLHTTLTQTAQGMFLNWNTQPGLTYQVQEKTNLTQPAWSNLGSPRYAAGTNDSVLVPMGYYQVLLQR